MKLISITSGKGGVGKTTVTCNLAMSLAAAGHRVLIFDGDIGMANVDIFFGLRAQKNIKNLLDGEPILNCIINMKPSLKLKFVRHLNDCRASGFTLVELLVVKPEDRRSYLRCRINFGFNSSFISKLYLKIY